MFESRVKGGHKAGIVTVFAFVSPVRDPVGLLNPDALGRMEFFALQQSVASATKAKAG
jgi:hypothetical protein